MTILIRTDSSIHTKAQAIIMLKYTTLIDSDDALDAKIQSVCVSNKKKKLFYNILHNIQALAVKNSKYGAAQMQGLAKGACRRGLFSAAFLLCLKVLTSAKTVALILRCYFHFLLVFC